MHERSVSAPKHFEAPEIAFETVRFSDLLETFERQCPEVVAKRQAIESTASTLIEKHGPSIEFYQSADNAIGLLFAAALQLESEQTANKSPRRTARETTLADNFSKTLFGRYSSEGYEGLRKESQLDPIERLNLFRRYQDSELSELLMSWIFSHDSMHELRQRLELTSEAEQNFEVIVLAVAQPMHTEGISKSPSGGNAKDYVQKLYSQGKRFLQEQQSAEDYTLPFAWVDTLQSKKYMCISEATARIVLDPDSVGFKDNGDTSSYIQSLIEHEFVHTQGDIGLQDLQDADSEDYLGLLLEEYRAEVFSGFNFDYAYEDIYDVVSTLEVLRGVEMSALMQANPGTSLESKAQFYAQLAAGTSLTEAGTLLALMSKNYIDFQSPASSRKIYELIGGENYEGFVLSHMSRAEIDAHIAEIESNVKEYNDTPDGKAWLEESKNRLLTSYHENS